MNVKVIWPDGSTEVRDHTMVRGLQKQRDNGSWIKPLAAILQPDATVYDMSDNELSLFLTTLHNLGIVVPAIMSTPAATRNPQAVLRVETLMKRLDGVMKDISQVRAELKYYENHK